MLLATVLLWALNATATKYAFNHGWRPLAFGSARYFSGVTLFAAFTLARERSLWVARSDWPLIGVAAVAIFVNQLCFVFAVSDTGAATVAMIIASTPIFVGLISSALRIADISRMFWISAGVTLFGVIMITVGSGSSFESGGKGDLLATGCAITWAVYSLAVATLMKRYSPFRISAIVLFLGWLPLMVVGLREEASQSFAFSGLTWASFAYATIGPLFLTNLLWFTAIDRVGTARASLFSNLQPIFAVLFAVVLLSERVQGLEVIGGALILGGIAIDRRAGKSVPLGNA